MATLQRPQIPVVPAPPNIKSFLDIQPAFTNLYTKILSPLILYLQTYLTKVQAAVGGTIFTIITVTPGLSPFMASLGQFIATAAPNIVILPPATGSGGTVTVKKTDTTFNPVTIDPSGSDTIDGNATFLINAPNQANSFVDFAVGVWFIY